MLDYEVVYGLGHPIKSFAVANQFVEHINKGCYQLGKRLQPFCFYASQTQKDWGVLDITQFSGFADTTKNLVNDIADYRRERYTNCGAGVLPYTDAINKALFYDYLLSISICYVEIPKWITRNGVRQKSFDKFLATRNPAVMAAWMGFTVNEMQAKYSSKIQMSSIDFISDKLRVVKLNATAKGNTISVPRKNISAMEMTCTPLFMTYAFCKGFWSQLEQGIIKFTYLKDNDVVRELPSTINFDILTSYYDSQFISMMLQGVDAFSQNQGGMMLSSKQSRGYIKIPELGCSKYDRTGVRSLNISRILRMEIIPEVDRTFINVDLDSVIPSFNTYLDNALLKDENSVFEIYKAMQIELSGVDISSITALSLADKLKTYISTCDVIMSTSFRRSLHLFMITHSQWFADYTGQPVVSSQVTSSQNFGIETMNFL